MKFWELYVSTNNDKEPVAFRIGSTIHVLFPGSHRFVNLSGNARCLCELSDTYGLFTASDGYWSHLWDEEIEVIESLSVVFGIKQTNPTEEEILSEHEKRKSSDNPERNE